MDDAIGEVGRMDLPRLGMLRNEARRGTGGPCASGQSRLQPEKAIDPLSIETQLILARTLTAPRLPPSSVEIAERNGIVTLTDADRADKAVVVVVYAGSANLTRD